MVPQKCKLLSFKQDEGFFVFNFDFLVFFEIPAERYLLRPAEKKRLKKIAKRKKIIKKSGNYERGVEYAERKIWQLRWAVYPGDLDVSRVGTGRGLRVL